jgi:chaperone required for assembly of F1-ATPase
MARKDSTLKSEAAPLLRRFYKDVWVAGEAAPFSIQLDGKPLRTPLKAPLALPTRALAEAVADEWRNQAETIDARSMPLTKLANTAIDWVDTQRQRVIDDIVRFAGSDLVCYRASEPEALRERQARAWDRVIAWANRALDIDLILASGVIFRDQPAHGLSVTRAHASAKSSWELAAIHNLTTLTGSAYLALMVAANAITGEEAWRAAHVDEDWQNEHWGLDSEAEARRDARRREFDAALKFLSLLA